jgi:prepilin signal peptidase PulO-like enzyme (type II secretory pathway)
LILALLFGSFANVLIHRIPRKISIIEPGSRCPHCYHSLHFWENIPLLSYILLLGKCSQCHNAIGVQYPLVELITMLAAFPFTFSVHNIAHYVFLLLMISITVALGIIDYHHRELPLKLSYALITLTLVFQSIYGNYQYLPINAFAHLPQALAYLCTGLVFVGIAFFFLDSFVHFANKFYFKEEALQISPIALGLRIGFLHKHIEWVYFLIYSLLSYCMINQLDYINYIFLIIGASYFGHEVLVDFLFANSDPAENNISESKYKTIFGGGDTAMFAYMAVFFGIKKAFLVLLSSFYLAFIILICKKIYYSLKRIDRDNTRTPEEYIALGPALAIAFITAMIFF